MAWISKPKWITDLWNSFKNNPDGLSGRKVSSAWAIVVVATFLSYKYTTSETAFKIIGLWLLFGSICLGLVTIPELIKFIIEMKNKPKPE